MPTSDWGWYFSSENYRTNALRDEVESLQAMAASASAQSSRLTSQLQRLQGSIETRLAALSVAFDAYVELGDVREQLAAYPDTSAVRRNALRALDALAAGGHPNRLEPDDDGYWLVDATNEVVDLAVSGASSRPPGPSQDGPEHEVFVVAALGWLGRGELVQNRVAPLLAGDGALVPPQVVLWQAAAHGLFGDAVLDTIRPVWQPDLDLAAETWDAWASQQAGGAGPVDTMRWVRDLLVSSGAAPAPAGAGLQAPATDDKGALRLIADARLGTGMGDERELLVRARTLRDRIENPDRAQPDPDQEPPRTPTTTVVQQALLDPWVDPATRSTLIAWVRPGLQAAAALIASSVAASTPGPTTAHTEVGDVPVGPDGADPDRVAQTDATAVGRFASAPSRLLVPAIGAGVLVVIGVVLLGTDLSGLGVLMLILAAVGVVLAGRALLQARSNRTQLAAARERIRKSLDQGRTTAVAVRQASLETKAEAAGLARTIADVGSPVDSTLR